MIKFKILPVTLLAVASLTQACNSSQKKDNADSTTTPVAMDSPNKDTTETMKDGTPVNKFLEQAAIDGMVEVQMGKIGQQRATLKSIKDFAATLEKDHTEANTQLTTLAAAKGFKIPLELTATKKEHLNDLNKTSGKDFDSYYINMVVEDHITEISFFEGAAKSPDKEVSAYAAKVLPKLQHHYQQAREISMQFDQNKNLKSKP